MTRIPYPDLASLSPEKHAVAINPATLNLSKMTMHAPDKLWQAWRNWSRTAAYEPSIDPGLRELCIQRIGHLSRSPYEVHHHFQTALDNGASLEKCRAMETGDFAMLEPQERVVVQFVSELVENVTPSDATLAALRALYSDTQMFEIIMLVGSYMTTARIIGTCGFGIEEKA